MKDIVVSLLPYVVPAIFTLCGMLWALISAKMKSIVTSKLTEEQQRNDLRQYMIKECADVERFSKFLKSSMSKQELSKYKHDTVIKNMTMYASASGYTWYNSGVWGDELTKYIDEANAVSGKTAK